jgi:hypothetical protein
VLGLADGYELEHLAEGLAYYLRVTYRRHIEIQIRAGNATLT